MNKKYYGNQTSKELERTFNQICYEIGLKSMTSEIALREREQLERDALSCNEAYKTAQLKERHAAEAAAPEVTAEPVAAQPAPTETPNESPV